MPCDSERPHRLLAQIGAIPDEYSPRHIVQDSGVGDTHAHAAPEARQGVTRGRGRGLDSEEDSALAEGSIPSSSSSSSL